MKPWIAAAAAALAAVGACEAQQAVGLRYVVVGGKPGAAAELLEIDCAAQTIVLTRTGPAGERLAQSSAQIARDDDCPALARAAEALRAPPPSEPGVADGTTFSVQPLAATDARPWTWIGTLSGAPPELRRVHELTRSLLDKRLPGVDHYP